MCTECGEKVCLVVPEATPKISGDQTEDTVTQVDGFKQKTDYTLLFRRFFIGIDIQYCHHQDCYQTLAVFQCHCQVQ